VYKLFNEHDEALQRRMKRRQARRKPVRIWVDGTQCNAMHVMPFSGYARTRTQISRYLRNATLQAVST
jgi:hypothetical protein